MILKKSVAALVLGLSVAASASAYDFDYGAISVPSPIFSSIISHGAGSFADSFSFSIAQPALGTGWANDLPVSFGISTFYNIDSLAVTLFKGNFNDGIADSLHAPIGGSTDHKSGSGLLQTGNYYFLVSGSANGSLGGQYQFGAQTLALPVPEPETYAMFLAGLGLIGAIARRRKQSEV